MDARGTRKMNVDEMIKWLEAFKTQGYGESIVLTYCPDSEVDMPVNGAIYTSPGQTIHLQTMDE